jgi:hypothetical protein
MPTGELFGIRVKRPDGSGVETVVSRGDDGSFWVEPSFVGLSPERLEAIRRAQPWRVQTEPRGRLLVEMRRMVWRCPTEEPEVGVALAVTEYYEFIEARFPRKFG